MQRRPEPELMLDPEQARAYATADFEDAHGRFLELLDEAFSGEPAQGYVLDLGCGPGDIAYRFAAAHPGCQVHGIDGAAAMLACAPLVAAKYTHGDRVTLIEGVLPEVALPRDRYDAIISNSLLHHLHDPQILWRALRRFARRGAPLFVMDLRRADSPEHALRLTETYAADEHELLKEDFCNSLMAAFEPAEVQAQLAEAGLGDLTVEVVSDRHLIVFGRAP